MKRSSFWLHLSTLLIVGAAGAQQVSTVSAPVPSSMMAAPVATPVQVPFSVPVSTNPTLLAQPLPAGISYVAGSSKLDSQVIADPVRGPSGTLYWTLPAGRSGVLSFETEGAGPLPLAALATLGSNDRISAISGVISGSDWLLAQALPVAKAVENAGNIKLPLNGTDYNTVDQVTVVVEGPLGEPPVPLINGVPAPAARVGKTVTNSEIGVQRLEYYGLPLKVGVNTIQLGSETVTVRLAGPTARIIVEPVQLVADGVTPLRLRLRAVDALGLATAQDTVTLQSNLEPLTPDAAPAEAGYQVALRNGVGILELRPQATPGTLKLDIWQGKATVPTLLEVRPDAHAVGVGMVSATLGLGSTGTQFSVQARGYYEGPLNAGKLYISADKDGLPTLNNSLPTNVRFTNYGDSSVETIPLEGRDPVAFVYDHPGFRVAYRRTPLPLTVLPLGETVTALTLQSKADPRVAGFVAWLPTDRVTDQRLTPEGTRLLHLPNSGIAPGSQQITVVTLDRVSGAEVSRTLLLEGVDYTIDPETGIVTLARALSAVDAALNNVYVSASYRLLSGDSNRQLAFGAQVEQRGVAGQGQYTVGAGVVNIDRTTTFGVAGTYTDSQWDAQSRLMYSNGVLATASVVARSPMNTGSFGVRYQSAGYNGLSKGAAGFTANGRLDTKFNERWGSRLEGEYGQDGAGTAVATPSRGFVGAQVTYTNQPFTFGVGGRYAFGATSGFGITGSVRYERDPLAVEVTHTQGITGNLRPSTEFGVAYRINRFVTLTAKDVYTWGEGNVGSVALNSTVGNTNYIAAYETAGSGGIDNRARFGVSTTLPLNDRLSVGMRAGYLYYTGRGSQEITGGADLTYTGVGYKATLGTDLAFKPEGFLGVVRGGVSGDLTPNLNAGVDVTGEFGVRQGLKLGLGYAYRASTLSSLGYVRMASGSMGGNEPSLSAGVAAEYAQPRYSVRGGVDLRVLLNDRDTLTYQPYIGGTFNLSEKLRVGGWGRALIQPATNTSLTGFGVEAGVRALPGTWLNAGYNFKGFDGLAGPMYTREGAYLRLDLTLDETLGGTKK